jgi:hypothetical protein
MRERHAQVVRELVHENPIAFDDRRLHGACRHIVPVCDCGAEHDHEHKEQQKSFVLARSLQQLVVHFLSLAGRPRPLNSDRGRDK